jgi:hypothetical protein
MRLCWPAALALWPLALLGETPATLLDAGYRQMYNLEFDQAHDSFHQWERIHPEDPLGPLSDAAACLFDEFDRLGILESEFFVNDRHFHVDRAQVPDPVRKRTFEAALERGRRLADGILERSPQDADARFATVLRLGLHADYLALIEKRYLASLAEIKSARKIAEELLASRPDYYDAYLAIGVENYLLSQKPAPLRWLLRIGGAQTDMTVGLERLRLTAEKGRYLAPYARLLLAVAALRDRDRARARSLLAGLASDYPRNPLYAHELAQLP